LIDTFIALLSVNTRVCQQKSQFALPRFCTVYAVSKGKLSIRPSDMQIDESITDDTSEISFSSSSSSNYTSTTQAGIQIGTFTKL
jgi:hypothetical protein